MKSFNYKPHIDGLRAIAVIPVVLFHAGFDLFKGGFVGVDIFFVISGYLITSLIISQLQNNKFSLVEFYIRRARRILPILFFITLITIPFAIILMLPEDLKVYSSSVFSVITFVSNFFFWKNTGYFGPSSETQPLLHIWSLGVEEQFYLFFPLFLIFIWRWNKSYLNRLIIIILFISLLLAQIGGNFKIQNLSFAYPFFYLPFDFFWQAGSANFYLPFGRVWELMFGSLTSLYLFKNKIKDENINNFYTMIGILLILFSIFNYSDKIQYPSIFTLIPVLGTILLIIFSTQKTFIGKILSNKKIVFLGLISYSFYLWHQPLFAYSRIYFHNDLNLIRYVVLILIAFTLSVLSYNFIERPFRQKKIISNKKTIIFLLFLGSLILILSLLIHSGKISSIKPDLPKKIQKTFKMEDDKNCWDIDYAHTKNKKKWFCEIGAKVKNASFVIIGDSHALALKPGFDIAGKELGKKGIFIGYSLCPALLGVHSIRDDRNIRSCIKLNDKTFNYLVENKIKKIFLISRWSHYTTGSYDKNNFSHISLDEKFFSNKENSRAAFLYGLKNTIKKYNNQDIKVYFIHQVPQQVYLPNYAYTKSLTKDQKNINEELLNNYGVKYKKHMNLQKFVRDKVKKSSDLNPDFEVIDLNKFFCDKKSCKIGTKNNSFYNDKNHLSIYGASLLKNNIKKYLD
jgi:peptidoglycan/LPS O-acetylase OafA/YrhL